MLKLIQAADPLQTLDYCLAEIAEQSKLWPNKRAFLLVPESLKADSERRYLSHFDQAGLMMAEVLSFKRLCQRIFSEVGGLAVKQLSPLGQTLLLARILQEERAALPFLNRFAAKLSYAEELRVLLGDLFRHQIKADDLAQAAASCELSLSKKKLAELAVLQRCYEERKRQAELFDGDEDLARLSQLLRSQDKRYQLDFLRQSHVWVAGFASRRVFTPQEYELLLSLESRVEQLNICLCLPPSGSPDEVGQGWTWDTDLVFKAGKLCQERLRRQFPQAEQVVLAAGDRPKVERFLLQFPDEEQELAWCTGEILRLLKEGLYQRRDIALALCNKVSENKLRSLWAEEDLDPFFTEIRSLKESRLYRYLAAFFNLSQGTAIQSSLSELMRSGLCSCTWQESDSFLAFLPAAGLKYLAQLEQPAFYQRRPLEAEQQQNFYQQHLRAVLRAAAELSKLKTVASKASYLLEFLASEQGVKAALNAEIARLKQELEVDAAVLQARAWEVCLTVLEQAEEILGESQIEGREFAKLLLTTMPSYRQASIPLGIDRIRVGNLEQLSLYPCKVLFILGATRDSFPLTVGDEGFLLNSEREWVEQATQLTWPNKKRESVPQGAYLSYQCLQRPSQRLYLSCPSEEAEQLSALQRELAQQKDVITLCPGTDSGVDVRWLLRQKAPRLALAVEHRLSAAASSLSNSQLSLETWGNTLLWREALRELHPTIFAYVCPDPLSWGKAQQTLPPLICAQLRSSINSLSVSRLQSFNTCPYMHFAERVLGLQKTPEYLPDSQDRGSLLHALVEMAFRDLLARQSGLDEQGKVGQLRQWQAELGPEYCAQLYERCADSLGQKNWRDASWRGGEGQRLELYFAAALRYYGQTISAEGFWPTQLEWQFHTGQAAHLQLSCQDKKVPLRGIVDRIDTNAAGEFKILDYKSGSKQISLEELYFGLHLQLPLYALAWQSTQPEQKINALALQYFRLPELIQEESLGGKLKAAQLSEREMQSVLKGDSASLQLYSEFALLKAQESFGKLLRGDISARPSCLSGANVPCTYCSYQGLCRFDKRQLQSRVEWKILPTVEGSRLRASAKEEYLRQEMQRAVERSLPPPERE